jgi:hypothetical protein
MPVYVAAMLRLLYLSKLMKLLCGVSGVGADVDGKRVCCLGLGAWHLLQRMPSYCACCP